MTPYPCIERNLLEFFQYLARGQRSGETVEMRGVSVACAGVAFQMFNAAFVLSEVTSLERDLGLRLAQAEDFFASRRLRWSCWVCEDCMTPPVRHLAMKVFADRDLSMATRMPGLVAEQLKAPRRPLPKLEFRRILDPSARAEFCHITSVAFRLPYSWCKEVYGPESLWDGAMSGYLGYQEGRATTTAVTFAGAGAIGLYCVATLPEHERRGCAEAVVRYALEDSSSRFGISRSILQATSAGLPLYLEMGYKEATNFAVFASK